jgi:hypothetical protein
LIAFSMALMDVLSKGEMRMVEASGVEMLDSCFSGVMAP